MRITLMAPDSSAIWKFTPERAANRMTPPSAIGHFRIKGSEDGIETIYRAIDVKLSRTRRQSLPSPSLEGGPNHFVDIEGERFAPG